MSPPAIVKGSAGFKSWVGMWLSACLFKDVESISEEYKFIVFWKSYSYKRRAKPMEKKKIKTPSKKKKKKIKTLQLNLGFFFFFLGNPKFS